MYPSKPAEAKDEHGGYDSGLNHDAYQRRRWDEAYVFAYAASCEWAAAVCQWVEDVDKDFLAKVRGYQAGNDGAALAYDLRASYEISSCVYSPSNDGHWKGPGSGDLAAFVGFTGTWTRTPDSPYV